MAIEVPAEELAAVGSALRTKGVSASVNAESAARAADRETDGILHQGAEAEKVRLALGRQVRLVEAHAAGPRPWVKVLVS